MKADSKVIKLILSSETRRQFKTLCSAEGSDMTKKLIGFIKGEIERSEIMV